ncbi:MAG: peptidoglycan-binding protein, partial [Candidatus Vogelbacteria bacterium]|nr:peptidoglycan-binding protein [Candidatus Vogelbacteria bacterium]
MMGSEVSALQTALTRAGFPISASGNFDEVTASAVSSFQLKYKNEILTVNGLAYPTGYFGPATRRKINQLFGCNNVVIPSPITTPSPSVPSTPLTSPDAPGYRKSSIERSINTEIIVDTDSFSPSDS